MRVALAVPGLAFFLLPLTAQCPKGTSYGYGDDFVANAGVGIPLGFAFPLGGASYTHVHPSSNGFVFLSDGAATITNSDYAPSLAVFASGAPRIAALWCDLDLKSTNDAGLFVQPSLGQCEVVWHDAVNFGQDATFSFSLVLFASGDVQFTYDDDVHNRGEAFVGVSPGLGALQSGSLDLSASPVAANELFHERFAAFGGFDMAGALCLLAPQAVGYLTSYAPGGAPQCARSARFGVGCGPAAPGDIAYELMPVGGFDLSGAVRFERGEDRYTIVDAVATYVTPTAGAAVVSTMDDGYATVALSQQMPTVRGTTGFLTIATNGYVSMSDRQPEAGNSDYTPSVPDLQAFEEPTICGPWYDWSPNAGGQLLFEELAGIAYVTWVDVPAYSTTSGDTFQFQFEVATGHCTIVYEDMNLEVGAVWHTPLFGYTTGAAAYAVTQYDFSVDLAQSIAVVDPVLELSLDGNRPAIGGAFELVTTGIDPSSPLTFLMFGDAREEPGLPMAAFGYDAPGCSVYLQSILGSIVAPNVAGSSVASWTLPASAPFFVGMPVVTQSVCLTPLNPAGMLTSNGFAGVIGW